MKSLLLLGMSLLMVLPAFSQSCKFSYDKTDPFTNEKEQRVDVKTSVSAFFNLAFYHKGADYRIESYVNMPGQHEFDVPQGHKLEIKLGDGKKLTLENVTKAMPVAFISGGQVVTRYAMSYSVTREQYGQIAAAGITFVRTWLEDTNYYDYEFKPKEVEKAKPMRFVS